MAPLRIPGPGLIPRRVAIEVRPNELLWAESVWRPGGPRLRAIGREVRGAGEKPEELLRRFSGQSWLSGAELAVALRHPELTVRRLDLPTLSDRDARRVAERRALELAEEALEPVTYGCLLASGKRPRPAWLVACPEQFVTFAERRWRSQGVAFSHFGSTHIALGTLTRAFAAPGEDQLRAFLDIGADHAVCVVADAEGWVFSREIPVKLTRGNPDADAADPVERLATELRRTFHYVDVELRTGLVVELILSGTRDALDDLAIELAEKLQLPVEPLGTAIGKGPAAGSDPAFATVVGLALTTRAGGANLLPPQARRATESARVRRQLVLATVATTALLVFVVLRFGWQFSSLSELGVSLEDEWRTTTAHRVAAEKQWGQQRRANEAADVAASLRPEKPAWSWALGTLGVLLPEDAFVSAVSGRRVDDVWTASLQLEFQGDDLGSAAEAGARFARRLEESPLWSVLEVARAKAPRQDALMPVEVPKVRVQLRIEAALSPTHTRSADEPADDGSETSSG